MSKEPETEVREGWRVPEGYVLVPVEPTLEMVQQGARNGHFNHLDNARGIYAAMIKAAPTLSAVGGLDNSSRTDLECDALVGATEGQKKSEGDAS